MKVIQSVSVPVFIFICSRFRCMQTAFEVFVGTDSSGQPKSNSIPGGKIVAIPQISEIRTSIGDVGHEYKDVRAG